ncbi:MAG: protein translocase subunit SecD [Phycisphaerales bacterium]
MKRPGLHVLFVLALAATLFWLVWPPKDSLRLGKDLRGGVSLTYAVKIPPDADSQQVLKQVIEVLKQRVNPTGVLDISFAPQGRDRIEVVMPLPSAEVQAQQGKFRKVLASLVERTRIEADELDRALTDGKAVERFGGANADTQARMRSLQEAWDTVAARRGDLDTARSSGGTVDAAEQALAEAELDLERTREGLEGRGIKESRMLAILALDDTPQTLRDPSTGKPRIGPDGRTEKGPSPRAKAIESLRGEYPAAVAEIDATLAAWNDYAALRTSLDDPEDLKRLFRGAGVLEFHIAVSERVPEGVNPASMRQELAERGPIAGQSPVAAWFPVQDPRQWADTPAEQARLEQDPASFFAGRDMVGGQYDGRAYLLLYTAPEKSLTHSGTRAWSIERANRSIDDLGRTSVAFQLDQAGGQEMSRLTGPNVGRPMAIVLDGQVYTAPTLQSRIAASGQITGSFGEEEIKYLIRVLSAGALEGQLSGEPVSVNVLGPSLGADNLSRGLQAVLLSVLVTAVLMLAYYLVAGVVADISLLINAMIIFGVMAFMDATFTLPGLAGVALSIAMAVDANVLIYERIREELVNNRESLRNAIRIGFRRALSAIFDGNVTNLIVCLVLILFAGTEVKGFGVTMAIGVFATFISGLWVTRVLLSLWNDRLGQRSLPMLPVLVPGVSRVLTPRVDWIAFKPMLLGFSLVVAGVCVAGVVSRGGDIFDTEFRGGVAMTMTTRAAQTGEPSDEAGRLLLDRAEVERRVQAIGQRASADPILAELQAATVLTVGQPTADFRASSFQIKSANPAGAVDEDRITSAVTGAVVAEFAQEMDARLPSSFKGKDDPAHAPYTFALDRSTVGACIGRGDVRRPVGNFRGGVAIVLDDVEPPVTAEDLAQRLVRLRNQPDFAAQSGRDVEVVGMDPAATPDGKQGFRSLAVLVRDPEIDGPQVDLAIWEARLAAPEWKLAAAALGQGTTLDQVSSFSPAVARSLVANAVVAVILSLLLMLGYIWIRFGSLRYSASTVIALLFNLCVCLGLLSFTGVVSRTGWGAQLLVSDFRIDLNVVAGLLTIVGYSLNDTVVIMDRIRENRGKAPYVTRAVVNSSINQTFSRTVLTGGTTVGTALILYALGGTGIRPFAFTFLVGLIAGTFSSVAIAAPLVYARRIDPTAADDPRRATAAALPA